MCEQAGGRVREIRVELKPCWSSFLHRSLTRSEDGEVKELCPMSLTPLLSFQWHLLGQVCAGLCMQEKEITFSGSMCCSSRYVYIFPKERKGKTDDLSRAIFYNYYMSEDLGYCLIVFT